MRSTPHFATPDVVATVSAAPATSGPSTVEGWWDEHLLALSALIAVMVMAGLFVICLRTANNWHTAPVCGSGRPDGRCVTETHGEVVPTGSLECSTGQYGTDCTDLPVDLSFEDGTTRHMNISQRNRITAVLSGGQRNAGVVPRSDAPLVGRFYRDRLVELVFPSTGARLATDDFPDYTANAEARLALLSSPVLSAVIVGVVAWMARRRPRRSTSRNER